jgi:hypothetical protein
VERETGGREVLGFARADLSTGPCGQAVEQRVLSGTEGHVLSGTPGACYQEQKAPFSSIESATSGVPNLESNLRESNSSEVGHRADRWITAKRAG